MAHSGLKAAGPALGVGVAPCHHGEWLQGEFLDADGYHPALVTVPCPLFQSRAEFSITCQNSEISVTPTNRVKALRAARLALEWFGARNIGGELRIENTAPLGFGFGSSTADCLSTIRAVAAALERTLTAETEAHLTVSAEGASDSTMFGVKPVLFAQCKGKILEEFGPAWPDMILLGFRCSHSDAGVDTLALTRPRYTEAERDEFERLRKVFEVGITIGCIEMLGSVANRSAEINQSYFPIPRFSQLRVLALEAGAAGLQVAHTGCIAGLIFRHNSACREGIALARRGLLAMGIRNSWRFRMEPVQPAATWLTVPQLFSGAVSYPGDQSG